MNYKKTILSLRGEPMPKTFPSQKEIDKLPKRKIKQVDGTGKIQEVEVPDLEKLEKETVGNIILNCLANYRCNDKKDGFYVNLIAESVIAGNEKVELKDKLKTFLIGILEESILRRVKKLDEKGNTQTEDIGLYAGFAIAQVLSELGIKLEE